MYSSISPIRYIVDFWESPRVSYHARLDGAKKFALYTAKNYGGKITCEYSDGTFQEIPLANPKN